MAALPKQVELEPSKTGVDAIFLQALEELGPIWTKPLDEEEDKLELHPVEYRREVDGWTHTRVVPDTGAVRSVCPEKMAAGYEVKPSQGSIEGREFIVASGGTIPHQGQLDLPTVSNEGIWSSQRWEVAPVTKPLLSIPEECDKGQIAVFGPGGGAILHLQSREVRRFARARTGGYELEMWIPPAPHRLGSTFPRQDR